jgi:hypothetical protein
VTAPSRAPYFVAGIVAAVPLLVLAAAAPGGRDWQWLEYPKHITLLSVFVGLLAMFHAQRMIALAIPLLVAVGAILIEVAGGTHGDYLTLVVIERLATWLVSGLYAALAWLAIERADDLRTNVWRAGAWLVVVGGVAAVLTVANPSWLTFENIGARGTFRSSVAWPDSKILSIVVAAVTLAAGVAAIRWGVRSNLPTARVHQR